MPRWIPLESNPEVLNSWAKSAGLVVSQDKFVDVYGLDPELLNLVQQPAKAVILLFPVTEPLEVKRREEDATIAKGAQLPVDPTVFWIKQTIPNACGTIALLHALTNSDVTVGPESPLSKFIDQCKEKTPQERAELLESTPLFADIHLAAASSGQSAVPPDLHTDLHFTCFVQAPSAAVRESLASTAATAAAADPEGGEKMRLLELDGRRAGPVDRGECTDFLKDVAKVVKEYYISSSSSMSFSMLSLSGQKKNEFA